MSPASPLLSLSLPLLTYASRSADCADVASCHSQSVSLCSTSPKGFALSRTHARAHTHTHTHTHTHLCLQLSRRSTALNGLSLPVVPCEQHSFVLQVFNPQVLYSSSCRQLCHQGCSWKDPSSDFVMQHRSDACRVVEAGNKTTLNMWFRTHLCCLKSVAVWWQPELSAQYSSDYVNVSVGQITVVMPLCALDRITWRTAAQACWQI